MAVSAVPAPLEGAILQASQQYHVPHDLLEGIWRIESGSTYPNPAVNSIGYGGLFGTKDAFGPTQEQANLSASILASDIKGAGGSIAGGLHAYSGGGYSSVPGETSYGYLNVPAGAAPPTITSGGSGGFPGAQPISSNPLANIGSSISGSIKEAAIRLAEIALALILGYLGLKALANVLGRPGVTVNVRPQTPATVSA